MMIIKDNGKNRIRRLKKKKTTHNKALNADAHYAPFHSHGLAWFPTRSARGECGAEQRVQGACAPRVENQALEQTPLRGPLTAALEDEAFNSKEVTSIMKKILKSSCLLLVFILCTTPALAEIVKGPYLLFEGNNTSMAILWQADRDETHTLSWGTDKSYSMGHASIGAYGSTSQVIYVVKYVITELQPDTKYFYNIDDGKGGSGSFRTAPATSAKNVQLFAYGDTRTYPEVQEKIVARMRKAYINDPSFQSICLHSGDWVESDEEENWTNQWFVNNNTEMYAFQSEVPIVGARGNHETHGQGGQIYKKYFPEPYQGKGFYWSFDYGPAHVAVIDQYIPFDKCSEQYAWLDGDLAKTDKKWKIVVLHEPGWSANGAGWDYFFTHGNNRTVQSDLQPLFKNRGVQLVIGGHNHYYARAVVDGVQHLTLGGGGVNLRKPSKDQPNIVKIDDKSINNKDYKNDEEDWKFHHYAEIKINENEMELTVRRGEDSIIIDADGTPIPSVIESIKIPVKIPVDNSPKIVKPECDSFEITQIGIVGLQLSDYGKLGTVMNWLTYEQGITTLAISM